MRLLPPIALQLLVNAGWVVTIHVLKINSYEFIHIFHFSGQVLLIKTTKQKEAPIVVLVLYRYSVGKTQYVTCQKTSKGK